MSDVLRTIRFNEEDAEAIRNVMEERGVTFNAAVHVLISEDVHVPEKREDIPDIYRDIEGMVSLSGCAMENFLESVCRMMESGEIMISGRGAKVAYPEWVERFEDECHDMCIPVEKAVESAIKAMRRGV